MRASEPGYIGSVRIRNRIVMAPMISNLATPEGITTEAHMAYLEARARGGAGLIITEYTYINDANARGSPNQLAAYSYERVPKLRRLTERIHRHGAKAFMQIVHAGGKANADINRKENFAPTAMEYLGRQVREMTTSEVEEVREQFIRAAKIAHAARFDGIELHGAHGYLLHEFISPATNRRTDRYGGSFENRLRLPQEIVDALKSELDIPVGIRISVLEYEEDGYSAEYGVKVADSLRGIDYVHLSSGRNAPPGSSASFYSDTLHILRMIGRRPRVTTVAVGSIVDAAGVEEALKTVDFVAVGRGHLADPYFAYKVLNEPQSLRPCIRCNQACRDLSLGEVRCTVNPETGFEASYERMPRYSGDLVVAGGGVKGMEAALYASKLGLRVTLYERAGQLGGQLLHIFDERKKREFSRLLDYYRYALEKAGVQVVLGEEFRGKDALLCTPEVTYSEVKPVGGELRIDSNIYMYHDAALRYAGEAEVTMTERSLSSLDRARAMGFRKAAEARGVRFVRSLEDPTVRLIVREQYDLRAAMVSGRKAVDDMLALEGNLYL